MNEKQIQQIADAVVEYLFLDNDKPRKPVARLMLVYGGEEYKNPGWSRDAIKGVIVAHLLQSAQQITALDASPQGASRQRLSGSRQ